MNHVTLSYPISLHVYHIHTFWVRHSYMSSLNTIYNIQNIQIHSILFTLNFAWRFQINNSTHIMFVWRTSVGKISTKKHAWICSKRCWLRRYHIKCRLETNFVQKHTHRMYTSRIFTHKSWVSLFWYDYTKEDKNRTYNFQINFN